MRNKNIVLFSSGISEQNGILTALDTALEQRGYVCEYWRDLFSGARDAGNIALLPMLIKKIPTFDYAVLICEGHDTTVMFRNGSSETVQTMRDNVLFEIGLCVMALGPSRTILVTDSKVRLPDDLTGLHNETALKRIVCRPEDQSSWQKAGADLTDYLDSMERVSDEIGRYIMATGTVLSPVVIGAASSTACGYVSNFIFRTLEHIDDGILTDCGEKIHFPISKIHFHIVLPVSFDSYTSQSARIYLEKYHRGKVLSARNRAAEFRFEIRGDELHIIDFPTTLVTSYDTARMILALDADDIADPGAAERFTLKELNLYEAALRQLLSEEYLAQVLEEQYPDTDPGTVSRMKADIMDIIQNRMYIEYI
ncbi:MAG: nucleotide-binding protein [Clostridia bacterium]|nr:nucleotide-binding protein [Clostridia bacterium]